MENIDRFKFRFWNGEKWIYYGLFDIPKNISYIDKPYQSTGFRDKNGKLIYENDFVKVLIENTDFNEKHFGITNPVYKVAEIVWSNDILGFRMEFEPQLRMHPIYDIMCIPDCDIEIIGNKFSNPELLKGE